MPVPSALSHLNDVGQTTRNLLEMKSMTMSSVPGYLPNDKSYKGASGRIGVIGGSSMFHGAPAYAAEAALACGMDIAFIFTVPGAAQVLKTCCKNAIVIPVLPEKLNKTAPMTTKEFSNFISGRIHALLIGPGLGRDPLTQAWLEEWIKNDETDIPLILDAEGLELVKTLLSNSDCKRNSNDIYLTPNAVEAQWVIPLVSNKNETLITIKKGEVDEVSNASLNSPIGIYVESSLNGLKGLLKTWFDLEFTDKLTVEPCPRPDGCTEVRVASWRRPGGLGDVFGGVLASFAAWRYRSLWRPVWTPNVFIDQVYVAIDAVVVMRLASCIANVRSVRSMQATHVLEELGDVVEYFSHAMATDTAEFKVRYGGILCGLSPVGDELWE